MTYGLKYTVPFKTITDIDCVVNIEEKGYIGQMRELKGGAYPFKIETGTGDLLIPFRSSLATLSVFGSDYLQDLYTSDPQGIKITLYVNGSVHWLGYMTPDTFSQDFTNPEFIYEVECASALSSLKYREFDLTDDFVTFWEIVNKAREYAGYRDVYYTNSVRAKSASYFALRIASANFYDELGEAMTYYEVLEEIAKYAGCCFTPYKNDLYFLDYQAIKSGYVSYSIMSGNVTNLADNKQVINYKGTGTKISRIAGKNKAVVNCSLYEIDNILPEFNEEGSVFVPPMSETPYKVISGDNSVNWTLIRRYYTQPRFTMFAYVYYGASQGFTQEEIHDPLPSSGPTSGGTLGSGFVRVAEYETDNKPSSLTFSNEIHVRMWNSATSGRLNVSHEILRIVSDRKVITHKNVYLCISLDVMATSFLEEKKTSNYVYADSDRVWNVVAKLRIGNRYYDGEKWVTVNTSFKMPITVKKGSQMNEVFFSLDNTNTYETGVGNLDGYLIKAHDEVLIGECELTLFAFTDAYDTDPNHIYYRGHRHRFRNIKLTYGIPDAQSVYGDWVGENIKNDVIYENVIEGEYIDPADEIDLKICTNSDGKLALSSVLEGEGFLEELETDVFGTAQAENLLLQRVVDLYDKPRFVIDPTLANDAKPWTVFAEPYLDKQYLNAGGEEDIKMESTRYNLIEV